MQLHLPMKMQTDLGLVDKKYCALIHCSQYLCEKQYSVLFSSAKSVKRMERPSGNTSQLDIDPKVQVGQQRRYLSFG